MNKDEVLEYLAKEVEKAGGVRKWALKHDIDYSFLSRVMNKKRPFSKNMLKAMGMEVTYIKRKPK